MFKINEEELNKHREQTLNEIFATLKNNQRVCCVRYTGYGKSYYILNKLVLLIEGQIIIVVPNNVLKEEYQNRYLDFPDVIVTTYQVLKNRDVKYIKEHYNNVSLIVADECHHTTSPIWRENLEKLEKYTGAKILGLTATPEKSDKENVIETFFNGVQISSFDLLDGIKAGFIPRIKYILGYIDINKKSKEYTKNMNRVDRYRIKNLLNVENIFYKYIPEEYLKDNLKILCFVPQIKNIKEAETRCNYWFHKIYPNKVINVYSISSDLSVGKNNLEIKKFKSNENKDSIDIMVSVDKLIEGLHLPNIGIEIMLRKTESSRVYFQQLGRVINDKEPIVFDLISNGRYIRNGSSNLTHMNNLSSEKEKVIFENLVEVYDETTEIRNILGKYVNRGIVLNYTEIKRRVEENLNYLKANCSNMYLQTIAKFLGISNYEYRKDLIIQILNEYGLKYREYTYMDIIFAEHGKEIIENKNKLNKRQICELYNVSINSFNHYVRAHNIKINYITNYREEYRQYRELCMQNREYIESNPDKLTVEGMSLKFGITISTFSRVIKDCGITMKLNNPKKSNRILSKDACRVIDENVDTIIKRIEDTSYSQTAREFNMTDYTLIRYLCNKYNYKKRTKTLIEIEKDLPYIITNKDNLSLVELAKKFNYVDTCTFSRKLVRNGVKTIPYNNDVINLIDYCSIGKDEYKEICDNMAYIESRLDNTPIKDLAKEFKITKEKLSVILYYHGKIIAGQRIISGKIREFVLEHLDYIEENCSKFTANGMASDLIKKFNSPCSRTALAYELKKLNYNFIQRTK